MTDEQAQETERRARRDRRLKRTRRLVSEYLGLLARLKLRWSHERIIGITGSIGKSSTKAAVVRVLEDEYAVDESFAEYNTRLGLLLSVYRQKSGEGSAKAWYRAMIGASGRFLTDRTRYELLVLEMGVSWPGGMRDTLRAFRPDISIFTGVAPVHLDEGQFADEQAILGEKAELIRSMKRGTAILNRDNSYSRSLEHEPLRAEVLWYGRRPDDRPVTSLPPGLYFDSLRSSSRGISADVHVSGTGALRPDSRTLHCPVLGEQHIYVLLPAILAGLVVGLTLERACAHLGSFRLPAGRMSLIPGINSCTILDSSRNSSPVALRAALETLSVFPARRRIALLGSMLDLGGRTESHHREIGRLIPRCADLLVTVGAEAELIADEARIQGMPESSIRSFEVPVDAGLYLQGTVQPGDAILAKGSRRTNLEEAIVLCVRDPEQATDLLFQQ
jgi:UDP-N-acetylmuramyl pentapeptide synthase